MVHHAVVGKHQYLSRCPVCGLLGAPATGGLDINIQPSAVCPVMRRRSLTGSEGSCSCVLLKVVSYMIEFFSMMTTTVHPISRSSSETFGSLQPSDLDRIGFFHHIDREALKHTHRKYLQPVGCAFTSKSVSMFHLRPDKKHQIS